MANELKGEVELVAADQSYTLVFSIDAICTLEDRLDRTFASIAQDMADPQKISLSMVRNLLHASLLEKHPDITLKQAGELIKTAGGIGGVMEKLGKAIIAAFPQSEPDAGKRPTTRRKDRTGSIS